VAFDTKVQGKIGFETLQARKGPGLPPVPVRKDSILHRIGPKRLVRASSLKSVKRQRYDKSYSSEDICFPLVKGFHKEGSPNRKIDSPHMKYPGIREDPSWGKCSKELTWRMKDTWIGCNE
jgi:hypothetical protein